MTTLRTFKATRWGIASYATGTLKALVLGVAVIDTENEAITSVADFEADEITGGTYARQTLTGVTLDLSGTVPALRADGILFQGLDTGSDLVAQVAVYDDASGDPVALLGFDPITVVGDLPIGWPGGILATIDEDDSDGGPGGPVDATDVTFTPTTPGDWTSGPSTAQEAFDELAGREAGGGGGGGGDLPDPSGGTYGAAVRRNYDGNGYDLIYQGAQVDDGTGDASLFPGGTLGTGAYVVLGSSQVIVATLVGNIDWASAYGDWQGWGETVVAFTQDGTGGHTVNWAGIDWVDGEIQPDPTPGATTRIRFTATTDGGGWIGQTFTHVMPSAAEVGAVPTGDVGAANGVAELDSSGLVPSSQLPAYVDDVIEAANFAALPGTGATGKIYVTLDTNITYRWSGSAYVEISASLALGETSSTAYRGDRGKVAYDFSQAVVPIAQIPTGTSGATVAAGNDPRITGAVQSSKVDAKGDILVGTADNTVDRLAVGADGLPLVADSSAGGGLAYRTPTIGRGYYRDSESYLFQRGPIQLGGATNVTPGADKILWWDVEILEPVKIDAQWLYSQTTNAGAKGRPGIWAKDPTTGQPTGLPLVTGAEIALTSTAYRSDTFAKSGWVMPGVYSVGWATNDATAGVRPAVSGGNTPLLDMGGASGAVAGNLSWISSWAYSSVALPDVTGHTFTPSTTVPAAFIRWRVRRS